MRKLALLALLGALLTGGSARADEKADALLKEVKAATAAIQSLTVEVVVTSTRNGTESKTEATVKLKRPNLMRVEYTTGTVAVSDGKEVVNLYPTKQYLKNAADPAGKNVFPPPPLNGFFNAERIVLPGNVAKCVGKETVGGTEYEVIEITRAAANATVATVQTTTRLYVGADKLIQRATSESKTATAASKTEYVLRNLKIGAALNDDVFVVQLPADAKPFALRPAGTPAAPRPPLVAVGEPAPDFNLPTLSGDKLALSEFVKGKKAVLVNFWFLN